MPNFSTSLKRVLMGAMFCALSIIILNSCKTKQEGFASQLTKSTERPWIGPDYWANPLQDWRLQDGRMECFVSGGDRNLYLLTNEIVSQEGFEMSVSLGNLGEISSEEDGWMGFKIGIQGDYGDYRDRAVRGAGYPIGLTTKGELFIGNVGLVDKHVSDFTNLSLHLQVGASVNGISEVQLQCFDGKGELLVEVNESVGVEWLMGGVALSCHAGVLKEIPAVRPPIIYGNWGFRPGTQRKGQVTAWFENWTLSGPGVQHLPEHAFGPIAFSQYTMSDGQVKISAQMVPVGSTDSQIVNLELSISGKWEQKAEASIDPLSRTALFILDDWDENQDVPYRLSYDCFTETNKQSTHEFEGVIRKEPWDKTAVTVAGFTGNNDLGFPNTDIYDQVLAKDPDFLFFSGDQIYEGVGGYGIQTKPLETACLDYLRKWYLYGWAYADLLKDRPSVAIPDDHDVYHGNIWGAGGIATPEGLGGAAAQDKGGYKMHPTWVNMVQRTQTSHLPDPYDPAVVAQNIGVYYTTINYAGISFAVLEDRKFKSAPAVLFPEAKIINGWSKNDKWDAEFMGDNTNAALLGERQERYLEHWIKQWDDSIWMKVVLSQTIFANVATLPEEDAKTDANVPKLRILKMGEYAPNDIPVQDYDSNGWPQDKRDKALEIIRKGYAFHIAGDQHLGSVVEYGVNEFNDAGYAFCVPAISNVWPRRWFPNVLGGNQPVGQPNYTGDFKDGFGNRISVQAVSNPVYTGKTPTHLYDRATGFGLIKFERESRDITMECWPRVDMEEFGDGGQYPGWPITVNMYDNYVKTAKYAMPLLKIPDLKDAVIIVEKQDTGETVLALRIKGHAFKPPINEPGLYRIKVGEPGTDKWKIINDMEAVAWSLTREFIVGYN